MKHQKLVKPHVADMGDIIANNGERNDCCPRCYLHEMSVLVVCMLMVNEEVVDGDGRVDIDMVGVIGDSVINRAVEMARQFAVAQKH